MMRFRMKNKNDANKRHRFNLNNGAADESWTHMNYFTSFWD